MADPLRVLYVTSELAPWVKSGGLGDVAQGLPEALLRAGVDIRILVPAYRGMAQAFPNAEVIAEFAPWGGALARAQLLLAGHSVPTYLLGCPDYFARPGSPYQSPQGEDWPDNYLRFGLLSRAAAALAARGSPLDWIPDVLHCNDWQCGLAPAYLAALGEPKAATVSTIHNLAYQGNFPASTLSELALPSSAYSMAGLEFHGHVSFLKSALFYSDKITTVSPAYAAEIQAPPLGFGMDGLLRSRSADLVGILNGIDAETWNPESDPYLPAHYTARSLDGKALCKAVLQRKMGLPEDPAALLLGVVSRLVEQKGIDLVVQAIPQVAASGVQLVALGTGQREMEQALLALAHKYPSQVAVEIGFSEALAHLVEAGADAFLMPSRFEPSGLNQLYSMRYGTPPIVNRTGGLADSVLDATIEHVAAGSETGFVMDAPTATSLQHAIMRASEVFRAPHKWRELQRQGMTRDWSWAAPAQRYIEVYTLALAKSGKLRE